jgi:hypothetical protein
MGRRLEGDRMSTIVTEIVLALGCMLFVSCLVQWLLDDDGPPSDPPKTL